MKWGWVVLAALATSSVQAEAPVSRGAELQVKLHGLRSARGLVHLCLTHSARRFLACKEDKSAVALTVPAAKAQALDLGRVEPGTYALLIVHDENGNGKLDMVMGIPREGFGFSNNPAMRPRAPKWEEIRFAIPAAPLKQQVQMRYVL
jgi:uncharacterized protein (DUF2141 family)